MGGTAPKAVAPKGDGYSRSQTVLILPEQV
jgi:hypothetical protein